MSTHEQQLNDYRKRAAEMEMLAAETTFPAMRDYYLRLAREWETLAEVANGKAGAEEPAAPVL